MLSMSETAVAPISSLVKESSPPSRSLSISTAVGSTTPTDVVDMATPSSRGSTPAATPRA